jgi:hypothetical protein
MRISNACLEPVITATESDPVVAAQFMRITAMIDPPSRLLRPSILLRVLRAQHRRRTGSPSVTEGSGGNAESIVDSNRVAAGQ